MTRHSGGFRNRFADRHTRRRRRVLYYYFISTRFSYSFALVRSRRSPFFFGNFHGLWRKENKRFSFFLRDTVETSTVRRKIRVSRAAAAAAGQNSHLSTSTCLNVKTDLVSRGGTGGAERGEIKPRAHSSPPPIVY